MSNWEIKSDMSFKSINKLLTELLFNASVHCSYYSCVQYILHILSSHLNMEDDEINNLNLTTTISTHKYLRTTIYNSLRQINPEYAVDFNDDIGTLMGRRVTADYKNEVIFETEARELRDLAYSTLTMLKTSYNL